MVEMTEDFLAPLVRYIREDQGIKDLNVLVPDGGVNPILGPPSLISYEEMDLVMKGIGF